VIIDSLKEGLRGGELEGRCSLISALLLSVSVYASKMSVEVSILAVVISALVTKGKSIRLITAFIPFYLLFGISALFVGITAFQTLLAFLAVISSGAIIFSSNPSEIAGALLYFKFPRKLVSLLSLALSILPVIASDFENARFLHGRAYYKLLKAFVSASVLRGLSLSESLYSKNFSYVPIGKSRRPQKKDYALVLTSTALFILALSNIP